MEIPRKVLEVVGEDEKQNGEFIDDFKKLLDKIESCSIPIMLKISTFDKVASATSFHHDDNSKQEERQLEDVDSKIHFTAKKSV